MWYEEDDKFYRAPTPKQYNDLINDLEGRNSVLFESIKLPSSSKSSKRVDSSITSSLKSVNEMDSSTDSKLFGQNYQSVMDDSYLETVDPPPRRESPVSSFSEDDNSQLDHRFISTEDFGSTFNQERSGNDKVLLSSIVDSKSSFKSVGKDELSSSVISFNPGVTDSVDLRDSQVSLTFSRAFNDISNVEPGLAKLRDTLSDLEKQSLKLDLELKKRDLTIEQLNTELEILIEENNNAAAKEDYKSKYEKVFLELDGLKKALKMDAKTSLIKKPTVNTKSARLPFKKLNK